MSECTERSEGREGMPFRFSMSECTERSEGREGMPFRFSMSECTERVTDGLCGDNGGKAA